MKFVCPVEVNLFVANSYILIVFSFYFVSSFFLLHRMVLKKFWKMVSRPDIHPTTKELTFSTITKEIMCYGFSYLSNTWQLMWWIDGANKCWWRHLQWRRCSKKGSSVVASRTPRQPLRFFQCRACHFGIVGAVMSDDKGELTYGDQTLFLIHTGMTRRGLYLDHWVKEFSLPREATNRTFIHSLCTMTTPSIWY